MIILDMMDSYPRKTHTNAQGEKPVGDNKSSVGKLRSSCIVADIANQPTQKINTKDCSSTYVDDKSSNGLNSLSRIFNGLISSVSSLILRCRKANRLPRKLKRQNNASFWLS